MFELLAPLLVIASAFAAQPQRMDAHGIAHVARFEGYSARAYTDFAQCSIGHGHRLHSGPCTGHEPLATAAAASAWLTQDVRHAEACVLRTAAVPLTQAQFNVLASLAYNLGCGGLDDFVARSGLNAGNYDGVPALLPFWVHARDPQTGALVRLPGLVNRRAVEAAQWRQTH